MNFIFSLNFKLFISIKAVELVKFVDKKTIREYVDENQLLIHMGGTDPFKYEYKTEILPDNFPYFEFANLS